MNSSKRSRFERDVRQKRWMAEFSTREKGWSVMHEHALFQANRFDLEYLRQNLVFVQPDGLRFSGHYKTPDCVCEVKANYITVGREVRRHWFDLIVNDCIIARTRNKRFALGWLYLKLVRSQLAMAA
jgi:hypothetical protein